ncbi:hypothetical protein [Thalassococcus sp. S3]|uniref:hypothetical protein n=1 Tax=Thalassococcus sp. S3 TaxID=2017482 RepID=UPI00352E34B2
MQLRVGPGQRGGIAPDVPPENVAGITGFGSAFGEKGVSPRGTGGLYVTVDQDASRTVGRDARELVRKNKVVDVRGHMRTVVDKTVLIDAGDSLSLRCGAASMVMEANGTITLNGKRTTVTMDALTTLLADTVKIN